VVAPEPSERLEVRAGVDERARQQVELDAVAAPAVIAHEVEHVEGPHGQRAHRDRGQAERVAVAGRHAGQCSKRRW
jgi:predicted Zn-dependent protease